MTDFFSFTGPPPIDCYPPAPLKPEQVLEIMEQQLKVLANMTARSMLISAGTKIKPLDLQQNATIDWNTKAGDKLHQIRGIAMEALKGESTDWDTGLRDICALIAGAP